MSKKRFLFALIIFTFSIVNVNAQTCDSQYTIEFIASLQQNMDPSDLDLSCSNGTPFTDEYLESINTLKEKLNNVSTIQSLNFANKLNTASTIQPRYFVNKLNIESFQQENQSYCGPANVKQVLHYINHSSLSQSQYAQDMTDPTTGEFASVYQIRNTLNAYLDDNDHYQYIPKSLLTESEFYALINVNINNDRPLILHANTTSLYMYNGHVTGHYITISGHTITGIFDDDYSPINIYYVNTDYLDYGRGNVYGEHMDTFDNVYNALNTLYGIERYLIYNINI